MKIKSLKKKMTEYKVCMLGEGGVGKSAITVRFKTGKISSNESKKKKKNLNKKKILGSFLEEYDPTSKQIIKFTV